MDFDPKGVAVSLVGFSMAMVGLIASIIAPAFNYIPSMRPQMPPMVTRPPPPRQIASQRHSLVHSSTSGGSAGASASDTASSSSSAVNDVPQQDQLTFHAGEEKSTTPSERDTFHSSSAPPIAYTGSRIKPYPLELQRRSLDSEHDRAIFSERKGPLPDFARSPQSSHSSHVTILAPSTRKPVRSVSSPASSVQRRSSPTPRSNLSYPPIEPETFETSNAEAEASGSALLRSKSTPGEQSRGKIKDKPLKDKRKKRTPCAIIHRQSPPNTPVLRTQPYEAPYYFPVPGSEEARDYVQRTRFEFRRSATMYSTPSPSQHSTELPSPPSSAVSASPKQQNAKTLPVTQQERLASHVAFESDMGADELGFHPKTQMKEAKKSFLRFRRTSTGVVSDDERKRRPTHTRSTSLVSGHSTEDDSLVVSKQPRRRSLLERIRKR